MRHFVENVKQRVQYRQLAVIKPFGHNSCQQRSFTISFCDARIEIAQALSSYFHDIGEVEVLQGNILNLSCHALVSPANSFGDMGGGLDKAIDAFYQHTAQGRVRKAIEQAFLGELPVGNALIVSMQTTRFPYLIVAPTMRIPGNARKTIHAYQAMRAILVAIIKHNAEEASNVIKSVAIPGLCSGVGGMLPQESAEQMRVAYDMIMREKWKTVVHPALAPYAMREES